MTKEEYNSKLNAIYVRRKNLFKKINKCDKDIAKLNQQFAETYCSLKKGDKYILTNKHNGEKEYLIVDDVVVHTDSNDKIQSSPCIRRALAIFKRVNSSWKKPRRWDWYPIWEVDIFEKNNFELPNTDWDWQKVNE